MTNHSSVFRTEALVEVINGRQVEVVVKYMWSHDDNSPDFDFGDDKTNESEMGRFIRGEMLNLYLVVEAHALGLEGSDSLGQVFVRTRNSDFDINESFEIHQMRESALLDLRSNMLTMYEDLKLIFEAAI